jgi:ketosteroid isomerase-like protein
MSGDHVDLVRRSFELIAIPDLDAVLELYTEDVEFLPLTGTRVESGGYIGHAGVREYFQEAEEVWELMRPHAETFETVGDDVVAIGGCAVRGRGSGAVTDSPMAWVITVRDGRIARHRGYRTAEEALQEVGL